MTDHLEPQGALRQPVIHDEHGPIEEVHPDLDDFGTFPAQPSRETRLAAALACLMRRHGYTVVDIPAGAMKLTPILAIVDLPGVVRVRMES